MEIVRSIYNIEQLNNSLDKIDAALLMNEGISLVYNDLNLDSAIDICISNNIKPIIALNKIFQPTDIKNAYDVINKYKNNDKVYYYVTDIGIINVLINNNIQSRAIFNPETMITNTFDLLEYSSFNLDALAMSLEITLSDLIKSYNESKSDLFYLGFGHRLMFYSKRKLITLYGNKNGVDYLNDNMYLRESTRDDLYPVIENVNGTVIYRSYLISLLKHLNEVSFLKYLYCDSLYINENDFQIVLDLYYKCAHNQMNINEALNILNSLNLDIKDGFLYKDSVYQKEELKG